MVFHYLNQPKWKNIAILSDNYNFVPVGVETYGAYGPQGIKLVKQIGKKIQDATDEKLSTFFFYSKVYQWQYNEAMRFALWVAQRIYLQA